MCFHPKVQIFSEGQKEVPFKWDMRLMWIYSLPIEENREKIVILMAIDGKGLVTIDFQKISRLI